MPNRDTRQSDHPTVALVLNSIAGWVNNYRERVAAGFGQCDAEEVSRIAVDMGMSTGQLRELVKEGPHAADKLQQMLIALKVDPKHLSATEPLVMRDLQRLCGTCRDKQRCAHELDMGTAAAHFEEFCPNALTLDALVKEVAQHAKQS